MILLRLNRHLYSIAKNPLRKRARILKIAARLVLELWALTLISICPLMLYCIYLFSQVKTPGVPGWQASIERQRALKDSVAESVSRNTNLNRDLRWDVPDLKERLSDLSSKAPQPLITPVSTPPPFVDDESMLRRWRPKTPAAAVVLILMMCVAFVKLTPYVLEWFKNTRTLARRFTMIDAESLLSRDARKPILYLRPFIDRYTDNDILAQPESDESLIFPVLEEIGPVITIGQPGETLPPAGAARIYVDSDRNWQQTVTHYLSSSQLTVISPGYSEGVIWETSRALRSCSPKNVIISLVSFHPELNFSKSPGSYELFRDAIKINTKIELPRQIGHALFVYFDQNWKPKLVKAKASRLNSRFIEAAVRDAMHTLLESKGIYVSKRMPLGWYALNTYHLLLVTVAVLIPVLTAIMFLVDEYY